MFRSRRRTPIATRTKIEVAPAAVRRLAGLDDLARILFPDNKRHQRAFIAIWTEIKYADDQFVATFSLAFERHCITERTGEIVRAKMKKMGLLSRISHFSPSHDRNGGWTFSNRFLQCLRGLADATAEAQKRPERAVDEQKDRDSMHYI